LWGWQTRFSFGFRMNKVLKQYLCLLGILVFYGYGNTYAYSFPDSETFFSNSTSAVSKNLSCKFVEDLPAHFFADATQFEIQKQFHAEVADVEEEEEEESDETPFTSHKNYVYGSFTAAVFYALSLQHFSGKIDNDSYYFKPNTFNAPCKRHIRFQVFII